MKRAEFLKTCCGFSVAAFAGGALLESCAADHFATGAFSGDMITISRNEFLDAAHPGKKPRKYIVIRNSALRFPVILYRFDATTFSALSMECTHKSCELNPHGEYLICPCHGSEFDSAGKVQNPPAETDLQAYPVTFDDENIYVRIS